MEISPKRNDLLNAFSIQGLFVFKSPKITAKDMMNREICQFYL